MIEDSSTDDTRESFRVLDEFLDDIYAGQERLSSADLQRSAIAADLPATAMTLIDALPEGEYAQDEASEALRGAAA
jgi:hypothetical protein